MKSLFEGENLVCEMNGFSIKITKEEIEQLWTSI